MSAQKFRPYFTSSELLEIIHALKQSPSPSRLNLISYLETFAIKIERGVIDHQLTLKPTLEERLELTPQITSTLSGESLYAKWLSNPSICSPKEIELILEYRYENNLLTPQEEKAYEQSIGANF